MSKPRISVLGAGAWGTALANAVANETRPVVLYGRNAAAMKEIATVRANPRLPGVTISPHGTPTAGLSQAADANILLLVVPAQSTRALAASLGFERAVAIVGAAADALCARLEPGQGRRVGVVGFCWGGSVAYLGNTRLGLPAVSYYGARTVPFLDEPLRAPMLFHFGGHDQSIPEQDIEAHRRAKPEAMIHVYPAGHAFNRDVDPRHYDADSARLADQRTLGFLDQVLPPSAN